MSEWRVVVNDGQEVLREADGLFDVLTVDTFNPFGDFARGFFDDLDGSLFDVFNRGTKVEFEYADQADEVLRVAGYETYTIPSGTTETYNEVYVSGDLFVEGELKVEDNNFIRDFVGYVVNDLENESDGAEELEVEAYRFDQFLRGDEVTNDQTGNLISEALEDVIKTDVPPVDWNATLVDVEDDKELTESYQGDNVEEFLLSVREKSAGEVFGVTESLEFFFERTEVNRTSRDVSNNQWVTHDIGEQGGETQNQVTVSYNDGNDSVIVDNSSDQLEIQDNLGAAGPAQQGASITRPDITNINDAITAGERYLQGREATLTGPVTTFGLNDAQPGNVVGVTIDPRGIDTDFRIAENRTRWRSETNQLYVVERKGADDDILIEQSKTLDRVENRPRDNTVVPDRTTDTRPTALFSTSATTGGGVEEDIAKVVNDGRNRIRSGIINEKTIQSFRVEFSTNDNRPNRSDSSLSNVADTQTPTVATNPQEVVYSATSTSNGIQSIGVFDDTQDKLIAIARLESAVDTPSVDLTISLSDDSETPKTVWTNGGLNVIRDILAGSTPNWLEDYAYGSGSTEPAQSDTSLDTQVVETVIDETSLRSVSTTTEWDNILSISSTDPLSTSGDSLSLLQTNFVSEAENPDSNSYSSTVSDVDYSDGQAGQIASTSDDPEYNFTPAYEIPSGDLFVGFRVFALTEDQGPAIDIEVDGSRIDNIIADSAQYDTGGAWITAGPAGTISANTQHTVTLNTTALGSDSIDVDVVAIYDSRYSYTFDNSVNTNSGYLDGPELYPDQIVIDSAESSALANDFDTVKLETTFDNTDNNQKIGVSLDGTTYQEATNSNSITHTFGTESTTAYSRYGLSRYSSSGARSQTPRLGYDGQSVDASSLTAIGQNIRPNEIGELRVQAQIEDTEAVGSTFAEGGIKDTSDVLLTRSLIPEFQKEANQSVFSSEILRWQNEDSV